MSRYCGNINSAPAIAVAEEFKEQCLINGGAIFIDEPIWQSKYIDELNAHFVENLDIGEGNFLSKLNIQLQDASPQAKILAAEMLWFILLCPTGIGPISKRDTIEQIFSWSGKRLEQTISPETYSHYLSDEILAGVGGTGTAYNTGRWRELVYFIRLTQELLKENPQQKQRLLSDRTLFAQWLEGIPDNSNRQLRHILLYVFFPDTQERIFSNSDRKAILTAFTEIKDSQYKTMSCNDIDIELFKLRQQLEQAYGTTELDYYVEPLHSRWQQAAVERDGQTTNEEPTMNKTPSVNNSLNQIFYGPPGTGKTYHATHHAVQIIDPDFYQMNKDQPQNLKNRFDALMENNRIAFVSFHQSFSYEDFVEGLKATTNEKDQVCYSIEDGIFKRLCAAISAKQTRPNRPSVVNVRNKKIWKMSLGEINSEDSYVYQQCIDNNYVLLGYGLNIDFSSAVTKQQIAELYRREGVDIKNESNEYQVTSIHRFKNEMNIGDLIVVSDGNRKFRAIAEITSDYYFDDQLIDDGSYSQARKVIWHRAYEPSLPIDELFKKNLSQMTLYRLHNTTIDLTKLENLLSYESTDIGLTPGCSISNYVIESITAELITIRKPNGSMLPMPRIIVDQLVEFVENKQISIEDIRQKQVFEFIDSDMEKYLVNGYPSLLAPLVDRIVNGGITSMVDEHSDKRVLIIDEINRGNVSNILGELITLIEPSKRADGNDALSVKLPYSKEPFSIPSNLYIIGTMNTADKSLTQLDIALRRRFHFTEMMTDYKLLGTIPDIENINIAKLVKTINQRIELLYDREHTIGHSFFLSLREFPNLATLAGIFEHDLLPLLEEYFFDDWFRISQVLGDHQKNEMDLRFIVEKFEEQEIEKLMGADWQTNQSQPYQRNISAFHNAQAYISIYQYD